MLDARRYEFADLCGPDVVDGFKEADRVEIPGRSVILDRTHDPLGASAAAFTAISMATGETSTPT